MPDSPFPPKKSKVPELSDRTFARAKKGLAIISMKAEWCGFCPEVAPLIDELAEDEICNTKGECVSVFRMDIDKAPKMADKLKIEGVPTVLFMKNGKEVARVIGIDKVAIRNLYSQIEGGRK